MGDWLQDRCNEIQKAQQEHIQKSFGGDFHKSELNDLIKSKKANIGEIHTWNGKKYKKQFNGKWLEVSEHGMTKKEHEQRKNAHLVATAYGDKNKEGTSAYKNQQKANEHGDFASKLSNKEHSDEEVGIKEGKRT